MRPSRFTAALGLACAASLGLGVTTTATASSASAATGDFYTPPAAVPAQPGTLMKSEKFFTGLNMWGNTTRIMYSSKDDNGQPTAVTGAYIEPWAAWKGPGPRPVVVYGVGTIGQGDQCAPSRMMASSINLSTPGSLGVNYETQGMNNLLAKGVAVVVTDYIGLGTPGRPHTYMNRDDQAHAMLDAARVASKVPGATVKANSKVATYGYSQGGGASAAAVEAAPTYAPDLDVAAAYVGAPPADLQKVLAGVDGSPIAGVIGYFINGAASSSAAVKAFADESVNATGKTMLSRTSGQCTVDTVVSYGYRKTSDFTATGEPIAAVMARNEEVTGFVRAQRTGTMKPTAAVRVATGVADDVVPHAQSKQLALDWCGKGANVTYAPIPGLSLGPKSLLNHANPMLADQLTARDWVVQRLSGAPATGNCSTAAGLK